jgi:cytochrome c553
MKTKVIIFLTSVCFCALNASSIVTHEQKLGEYIFHNHCYSCHGINGEKTALNQSRVIRGMSQQELFLLLQQYKTTSYSEKMKKLMSAQVKNLNKKELEALAEYISHL